MKRILFLSLGLAFAGCSSSDTRTSIGPQDPHVIAADDDDEGDDDESEQKIAASELPSAVFAAVEAAVPGIQIREAEIEGDGYCVHGMVDGQFVEVEVNAAGLVGDIEYGDDDDSSSEGEESSEEDGSSSEDDGGAGEGH